MNSQPGSPHFQQQQSKQPSTAAKEQTSFSPVPSTIARPTAENLDNFCSAEYSWMSNDKGENPCVIARLLLDDVGVCREAEYYPLHSLFEKFPHYPIPTQQQASPCVCSMVVYNMIQSCSTCQSKDSLPWSTSWSEYSASCSEFPGARYPKQIANDTLPIYALIDSSKGSWEIGLAYKLVSERNTTKTSSSTLAISSIPATSTILSTSVIIAAPSSILTTTSTLIYVTPAAATTSLVTLPEYLSQGGPDQKVLIISIVLVILFAGGIGAVIALYVQKKIRTRRQGVRLGSSTDLPLGGGGGDAGGKDGSNSMTSAAAEKLEAQDSVSLFLPSESFLSSRPPDSRNSSAYTYTTNSSSSQSHHFAPSITDSDLSYTSTDFPRTISDDDRSSFITSTETELDTDEDERSPFADRHSTSTISLSSSSSSSRTISSLGLVAPPPSAYLAARFNNRHSINTERSDRGSILSASTAGAVYGRDD